MSNKLDQAREIINRVDREMAALFEERMHAAEMVAEYKMERGLEILDTRREAEVVERGAGYIENDTIREYYVNFLKISKGLFDYRFIHFQ